MAIDVKLTKMFQRIFKIPILKFVILPISWILKPFFYLALKHPAFNAIYLLMQIEKLESKKRINEARSLRKKGLNDRRISQLPELWCSEGRDFLFNRKDYEKALAAFQRAIKADPDYNPIQMYYGAACSAIFLGKIDQAKEYHELYNMWWDRYMDNPELKSYFFTHYLGSKNWIDKRMKRI